MLMLCNKNQRRCSIFKTRFVFMVFTISFNHLILQRSKRILIYSLQSQPLFISCHSKTFRYQSIQPESIPYKITGQPFQPFPSPTTHTISSLNKHKNDDEPSPTFDPYDDYDVYAAAATYDPNLYDNNIEQDSDPFDQLDPYERIPQLSNPEIDHNAINEEEEEEYEVKTVKIDDNSPILRGLNSNQIDAVTKPIYSITRVIAGPGSGKTRVLTNRIAWLLQQNPYDRILAVTFTRKASAEMQDRVHKLLLEQTKFIHISNPQEEYDDDDTVGDGGPPEDLNRVTLGTFHSVCTKILRWNGEYLSSLPSVLADMSKSNSPIVLDSNFNILDPRDQVRILKDVLDEYRIVLHGDNLKPDKILKVLNTCKSMLYNGGNPFEVNEGEVPSEEMKIATRIYYRFREKILSTNNLDFDDLIYMSRELLQCHNDVRLRLQRRWQHVFVDEYQDTSTVQVELIKLLTVNSLFIVGDADQSIYAWRGAYAESLYDFESIFKDFHEDGVSTVYLMENYRSSSKIVEAAQKVISLSSAKSGANKLRQKMIPQRSDGSKPRIIAFGNGEEEASFLVNNIKDNLSSGAYGVQHTLAFIYRTNAQSRLIEEACVQNNIPWINNGRDRMSMLRAFETPKRGLGDIAIQEFDEYCELVYRFMESHSPDKTKPTPLEIIFHISNSGLSNDPLFPSPSKSLSKRPLKLFTDFSSDMLQIIEFAGKATVSQTLQLLLDKFELKKHFDKISKNKDEYTERISNVDELLAASMRYEKNGPCRPIDPKRDKNEFDENQSPLELFLDDISMVTDQVDSTVDKTEEKRFVASLMTIHSSKGMEFDSVYFVGVEDGTIPSSQAISKGEGSIPFEEEKRLCYVAMTRAKSELVMTWRQSVTIFSSGGLKSVDRPRSRFLDVLVSKKSSSPDDTVKSKISGTSAAKVNQFKTSSYDKKSRFGDKSITQKANQIKLWSSESGRNSGMSAKPVTTFVGTSNVYARPGRIISTEKPKINTFQDGTPRKPRASNATRTYSTNDAKAAINKSSNLSDTSNLSANTIDSTWFFPVGSKVRHKKLGDGIVLRGESMVVLVEFRSGEKHTFPVQTTDLSPIII